MKFSQMPYERADFDKLKSDLVKFTEEMKNAKSGEEAFEIIKEKAIAWGVGRCTVDEIDKYNIHELLTLASIAEKEVNNKASGDDRKKVISVFVNIFINKSLFATNIFKSVKQFCLVFFYAI